MNELQSLSSLIQRSYSRLTEIQRKVADYLIKNEDEVAFLTIDKLSANIGVSTASITRFAMELGFKGYPAMQKVLREQLQAKLNPATRLQASTMEEGSSIIAKSFSLDIRNVQEAIRLNTEESLRGACSLIQEADRVYIVGYRSSYAIATYMAMILNQIRGSVELINSVEDVAAERILTMGPRDLLISFSFPRYNHKTVSITATARKKRGIKVFVITDAISSPLIQYADVYLLAAYKTSSFHNSYVAVMALINAISSHIASSSQEDVRCRLLQLEDVITDLNERI